LVVKLIKNTMKTIFKIITLSVVFLVTVGCHKENKYSNKLMDGQTWNVTDITVDGTSLNLNGTWQVSQGVDIEKTVPSVEWVNSNGNAIFEWQFLNKGKEFHISYVQQANEDGETLSELDYLAYDITGQYEVIRHKRKVMEFSSKSTLKYDGQEVYITIER